MSDIDHQFVFTDNTLDLYKTLGVNTDASVETIRDKYRELARIYHPDKARSNQDKEANTKLYEKIKQAYEILSSSNLRQQYDKILQSSFEDLKKEYKHGPITIEPVKNMDLDQFNTQFVRESGIAQKIDDYKPKTDAIDFGSYKSQRENINIENKFGGSPISKEKIREQASHIHSQLQKYINGGLSNKPADSYTNPTSQSDLIPSVALKFYKNESECDFKILFYLLSQFKYVQENISNNILLTVDFLLACKTLNETAGLKIDYDTEFVSNLDKTINKVETLVDADQFKKSSTLTSYDENSSHANVNFKTTLLDEEGDSVPP